MNKGTMLSLAAGLLCAALAPLATADELSETFDNPLGDWNNRWLYQNSTLENYYVASGNCNNNNRGNNSCGIWIADTQGCGSGTGGNVSTITFDPDFGATISRIEFDLSPYSQLRMVIRDKDGQVIVDDANVVITSNVCAGHHYAFDSNSGISSIELSNPNGQVEGWTAIDNVTVVTGLTCQYRVKKSKSKGGCETCPEVGGNYASSQDCEGKNDCNKKVKTTIGCPGGGPGTCKIKGKRSSCG